MAVVEIRATVSRAYYEKRNRRVAEAAINDMRRALGRAPRTVEDLRGTCKFDLITDALELHAEMPA